MKKYKIQSFQDRANIVVGFANSGYKVWVEEEKDKTSILKSTFYVCIEESK